MGIIPTSTHYNRIKMLDCQAFFLKNASIFSGIYLGDEISDGSVLSARFRLW